MVGQVFFRKVCGGLAVHVVACQPCPSLPLQVSLWLTYHDMRANTHACLCYDIIKHVIIVQIFLIFSLCEMQGNARRREETKGNKAPILPHSLHRVHTTLPPAASSLPSLPSPSICWIWKDSITMQQIGSGAHNLGIGSLGLNWSAVVAFLGSQLATPGFAITNVLVGYVVIVNIPIPISYWTNTFEAKRFPIFSSNVFGADGSRHDVNQVLDPKTLEFNQEGHERMGQIHLSIFFLFFYGMSFAMLASALTQVGLFHGR